MHTWVIRLVATQFLSARTSDIFFQSCNAFVYNIYLISLTGNRQMPSLRSAFREIIKAAALLSLIHNDMAHRVVSHAQVIKLGPLCGRRGETHAKWLTERPIKSSESWRNDRSSSVRFIQEPRSNYLVKLIDNKNLRVIFCYLEMQIKLTNYCLNIQIILVNKIWFSIN